MKVIKVFKGIFMSLVIIREEMAVGIEIFSFFFMILVKILQTLVEAKMICNGVFMIQQGYDKSI